MAWRSADEYTWLHDYLDHDYHTTHLKSRPETVLEWAHRNTAEWIGLDEDSEDSVLPLALSMVNLFVALLTLFVVEATRQPGHPAHRLALRSERVMKWILGCSTAATFFVAALAFKHHLDDDECQSHKLN